ncbi:MAG TPA: RNA 2',3'-cyclic phosphodiesterase [Lysobacter sp.]
MKHYTARMHSDLFGTPPVREAITHNVFFGIVPDADACARTARAVERLKTAHGAPGRWLKPDRYHLTLHFLGAFSELPQERIDVARRAAQSVAAAAFELSLDRAGHFSKGIGWLGCAHVDAPLQGLWSELHKALAHERVATQGHARFVPHVTVLRDAREPLPAQPISPIVWPVREFVLIDSVLGARNEYRPLGRWTLS